MLARNGRTPTGDGVAVSELPVEEMLSVLDDISEDDEETSEQVM
jgi:hypothetical protein